MMLFIAKPPVSKPLQVKHEKGTQYSDYILHLNESNGKHMGKNNTESIQKKYFLCVNGPARAGER